MSNLQRENVAPHMHELGLLDPALELPAEKRWMANALKKSRPHSKYLREGLADTVALMAVRASDVILGGTYKGTPQANFKTSKVLTGTVGNAHYRHGAPESDV